MQFLENIARQERRDRIDLRNRREAERRHDILNNPNKYTKLDMWKLFSVLLKGKNIQFVGSTKALFIKAITESSPGLMKYNNFVERVERTQPRTLLAVFNKADVKEILESIRLPAGYRVLVQFGNKYFTLSKDLVKNVLSYFDMEDEEEGPTGSDEEIFRNVESYNTFNIIYIKKTNIRKTRQVGFFPYINLTKFDLSRYGIYDKLDTKNYNENCYQKAFIAAGYDIKKHLYNYINSSFLPLSAVKDIAFKTNFNIKIKEIKGNSSRLHNFNPRGDNTILLGSINDHCFILEKTNITYFCINNYELVKDMENCNKIIELRNGKPKYTNNKFLDSYKLISKMIKVSSFSPKENTTVLRPITFSESLKTQYHKKNEVIKDLNYHKENTKEKKKFIKKPFKPDEICFFDFEASTKAIDENNKNHIPYLVCYTANSQTIIKSKIGKYCAVNFLKDLKDNTLCIAHNLSYDFQFLLPYLSQIKLIKTGSKIKYASAVFYDNATKQFKKLYFKDSLGLIPMPLRKFPKTFNLQSQKEVLPYDLYTIDNIYEEYASINDALRFIHKEVDKKQFIENLIKWKLMDKTKKKFKHIEYSKIYCYFDVKVLRDGYNIYKSWIKEITNIDIDLENIISVPQLSYTHMVNEGCFKGIHQLSGIPLKFITRACVGGRVMCCNNQKIHCIKVLCDFDGVSLYPSAFVRTGFLIGAPKVIKPNQLNLEFLEKQSGYFVEIKINKINRHMDFPIISYCYDNKRNFTNTPLPNISLVVDKYQLEDFIKYHEIEYEMIRGYYFDQGVNLKIQKVVEDLFNERREKKAQGNPIQKVYKLILNAMYGKLIQKEISTELKIITGEDRFTSYLSKNYNKIKYFEKHGNHNFVKEIMAINDHFNYVHCGAMVLSMSKRIMTEVMDTAQIIKKNCMYYSDTDSIHIENSVIPQLEIAYRNRFNRELIGENLGQFHSDFESDNLENPLSIESYFLGKKMYIDKLSSNGEQTGPFEYHIRMKGVSSSCIKGDYKENPLECYERLYNGETLTFDLAKYNKCSFTQTRGLTFTTNTNFIRKIRV